MHRPTLFIGTNLLVALLMLVNCATPLVVKTPNITKPVLLSDKCDQNQAEVLAEHREGYSSEGDTATSRTEGEDTNLEMKILTADPEDKKKTVISEIEFGSFSYLIFFVTGRKYWVNTHIAHCETGTIK